MEHDRASPSDVMALPHVKKSAWKAHCLPIASIICKCHKREGFTKYLAGDTLLVSVGSILDTVVFSKEDERDLLGKSGRARQRLLNKQRRLGLRKIPSLPLAREYKRYRSTTIAFCQEILQTTRQMSEALLQVSTCRIDGASPEVLGSMGGAPDMRYMMG